MSCCAPVLQALCISSVWLPEPRAGHGVSAHLPQATKFSHTTQSLLSSVETYTVSAACCQQPFVIVLCLSVLSPSLPWACLCSASACLFTFSHLMSEFVPVYHKISPDSGSCMLYLAPPLPQVLHMCMCRVWFFLAFKEKVVSLITEIERKAKVTFQ